MKNILHFLFILTSFWGLSLLGACSDKKDYDRKKAISAFATIDEARVDETLQGVTIKIPAQSVKNNSSVMAGDVENIFFAPQQNSKKFLNKTSQIWSGYRSTLSDRFVFAPVIHDGRIYLLDASGVLEAYCLEGKNKIWENRIFPRRFIKNYQNPRISYFNGKIFAIAGSNQVVAASAEDGKILWSKTILSLPVSTPISDGKFVYLTTSDNKTYALDASNGKLVWLSTGINKPTAILGSASPLLYKNMLLVSYSSGEIYALNRETGEPFWSQNLNVNKVGDSDFYLNDIDATPIIKNEVIYSIGNGGLMMAINAKNGNYLWKKEIAGITDFWLAGEFLYVINNDDKLLAIEAKSGSIKWITQLPNFHSEKKPETKIIYSGVVMAGNKLLITDARGHLLVASPADGKIEQVLKINQKIYHAPMVVDGAIYLHALGRFTVNLVEVR